MIHQERDKKPAKCCLYTGEFSISVQAGNGKQLCFILTEAQPCKTSVKEYFPKRVRLWWCAWSPTRAQRHTTELWTCVESKKIPWRTKVFSKDERLHLRTQPESHWTLRSGCRLVTVAALCADIRMHEEELSWQEQSAWLWEEVSAVFTCWRAGKYLLTHK